MSTFLIGSLVFAGIGYALYVSIKPKLKKEGGCGSCGCGCSCSQSGSCRH